MFFFQESTVSGEGVTDRGSPSDVKAMDQIIAVHESAMAKDAAGGGANKDVGPEVCGSLLSCTFMSLKYCGGEYLMSS